MKKIILCLLVILLYGCSSNNDLDSIFENTQIDNIRANNYTDYIEYYMPSDVNEESSEPLSFVFNTDDEKFIMNININNILNKEYYDQEQLMDDGFFSSNELIYEKSGSFINIDDEKISYFVKIYNHDNKSIIYIVTSELTMYGICDSNKLDMVTSKMFRMAISANVINNKVIADFSTKDIIDYQKTTVNLFEKVFPESGRVEDMLIDDAKVPE